MTTGAGSPADVEEWISVAASSEHREVEREAILEHLRDALSREPSALLWYLVGYAYYHLWTPLEPATAADALEALNRSLRIDPGYEWARLHKVYVQFESGQLVGCLADARVLDRAWFVDLEPELAWRVVSADEIEFACLVRLGIRTARVRELYRSIVDLATPADDDPWPYRPTIFEKAFDTACTDGHFDAADISAMATEVTDLMKKIDS